MKITVFTSNQARHLSLIEKLSSIADQVFAVQECVTIFPGEVVDFFKKSDIMQRYFSQVIRAEREVFEGPRFLPKNIRTMSIKLGDLNRLSLNQLSESLQSDLYIVFGSSYIKNDLIDFLISKRAINIHMGISPFYRGSSCNFWALYDKKPDLVGGTVHLLSKGLDSGGMLFHAVPRAQEVDPFKLGMLAVEAAQQGIINNIQCDQLLHLEPAAQDKSLELRYTRNRDFDDVVAADYLSNTLRPDEIYASLQSRDTTLLTRPFVG